jgi:hypothetical protein
LAGQGAGGGVEAARRKRHGVEPGARYTVKNIDTTGTKEFSGRELTSDGLPIALLEQPSAAIMTYRRIR